MIKFLLLIFILLLFCSNTGHILVLFEELILFEAFFELALINSMYFLYY